MILGAGPPNTDLGASPLNSLNLTKNNCGRVIPQREVIQRPLVSRAKHVSDYNKNAVPKPKNQREIIRQRLVIQRCADSRRIVIQILKERSFRLLTTAEVIREVNDLCLHSLLEYVVKYT